MAQSLTQRKGIVQLGHKQALSFLAVAILSILVDRLLKGISDPLAVSDLADTTGTPREDVIGALESLSKAGLINGPLTFSDVTSVAPESITVRIGVVHGLPLTGETNYIPPKPPAAPKRSAALERFDAENDREFVADDGVRYRGRVYAINQDNDVLAKACLTVKRLDADGEEIATAYENTYVDDEMAWNAFENYRDGFVKSTENAETSADALKGEERGNDDEATNEAAKEDVAPEIQAVDEAPETRSFEIEGVRYTAKVSRAIDPRDLKKTLYLFLIEGESGTVVSSGTRDKKAAAWEAVDGWESRTRSSIDNGSAAAAAPKAKRGRPRKS